MFGVADKRFGRVFILLAALAGALLVIWGAGFSGAKKAEAQAGNVPLVLIPGVGGSFIMDGSTEKWPNADRMALSLSDEFLLDLALRPDGTEDPNRDYQAGDILRKAPVNLLPNPNVYQATVDKLQAAGYREGVDFFVYPYDCGTKTATGQRTVRRVTASGAISCGPRTTAPCSTYPKITTMPPTPSPSPTRT